MNWELPSPFGLPNSVQNDDFCSIIDVSKPLSKLWLWDKLISALSEQWKTHFQTNWSKTKIVFKQKCFDSRFFPNACQTETYSKYFKLILRHINQKKKKLLIIFVLRLTQERREKKNGGWKIVF